MPAAASSAPPAVFDLSPPRVRFTATTPHQPLTTLITITNRSPHPQHLHLTPPLSHTLNLTPTTPHTANKLATGMSHTYSVTYTPALLHRLEDCLWVVGGEGSRQQLSIVCSGPRSRIQLRGPHSTIRTIVGGEGRTVLSADNICDWPVLVSFQLSNDCFRLIDSSHLRLDVGESKQLVLSFHPSQPGQHAAQLTYTVTREDDDGTVQDETDEQDEEAEMGVAVVGECVDLSGQIVLSESDVRLPSTFMTLASQHTVTLTNHSGLPVRLHTHTSRHHCHLLLTLVLFFAVPRTAHVGPAVSERQLRPAARIPPALLVATLLRRHIPPQRQRPSPSTATARARRRVAALAVLQPVQPRRLGCGGHGARGVFHAAAGKRGPDRRRLEVGMGVEWQQSEWKWK